MTTSDSGLDTWGANCALWALGCILEGKNRSQIVLALRERENARTREDYQMIDCVVQCAFTHHALFKLKGLL